MVRTTYDGNVTMPEPPKAARRFANGDEILGRYVVQAELGQGGMGVVYRCFDKIGGVEVAVKGLPPEVSHNADEMEAVRDNFQLVSELHHPNIAGVRTLEKDAATGDYYLVMTLARGVSLRHWLRQHGGKEHRTEQLNVLRQIASALDYAHNAEPKHIIHRDVKPENIMVDDGGHVMVLDFGLAAQVRSSLSRVSQVVTSRSGTPAYKSPEQWLAQAQRAPSDQYSLGVIAYQMFAGELPFDSDDLEILKHAVVFDPVPTISCERRDINEVFARALAKKPQLRFASCEDFVAALNEKFRIENETHFWATCCSAVGGLFAVVLSVGFGVWVICEIKNRTHHEEKTEEGNKAIERRREIPDSTIWIDGDEFHKENGEISRDGVCGARVEYRVDTQDSQSSGAALQRDVNRKDLAPTVPARVKSGPVVEGMRSGSADDSHSDVITNVVTNDNGTVSRILIEKMAWTNGNMVSEHVVETQTILDGNENILESKRSEYAQSFAIGEDKKASPYRAQANE